MNYFATDQPFARGEICVKTNTMTPGYYKNPTQTADVFVNGWYLTGTFFWLFTYLFFY